MERRRERRPNRCAIYTRRSVPRPGDGDFTSCDAQRDACLARVGANALEGWIAIEERFDDVGESGATTDRPALQRLLERVARREVDRVVVHRLDRLTRSVRDWATIVGTFKRYGTHLTVVAGDLHLGDVAMSDLVLNVLATFAEFEREMIASGFATRGQHCEVAGSGTPDGFRSDTPRIRSAISSSCSRSRCPS
jgi:DNA invertase Pin-like site-specific DNA recombinase